MFCPNCGNNCSDANFCPKCGTKLAQQTKQPAVWSVGQPCPHCGGTKLEGNNCAFCGAQLTVDKPEQQGKKYFGIPYGTYEGFKGYIILKEDMLVIKNWCTEPVTVPYEQINEVYYFNGKWYDFPRITIRWEGNKDRPIPVSYMGPVYDDTTIYYHDEDRSIFLLIFHTLKDIAEKNKAESK